jgi:acylphosphatase
MNTTSPKRYTMYFAGRVQGVGFRYNTASIARRHDVSGYVRNCPDGRVELVAEGKPSELDAFLREVRDYFSNNIRNEQLDIQDPTREFNGFDIRH